MFSEETFAAWAPPESVWSDWAKPVLFVHMRPEHAQPGLAEAELDVSWAPPAEDRCALILDLPGTDAIRYGVALMEHGYRPVPLFNGCPGTMEIVPTLPLLGALAQSAATINHHTLPPDAPPAFLLDKGRMAPGVSLQPGKFDNRWLTFPQDYPSANFLQSQGIGSALIVQSQTGDVASDLSHVLARWQDAGITLARCDLSGNRDALTVKKPRRYRSLWYLALALLGLRRSGAGGFGSIVPQPSSG